MRSWVSRLVLAGAFLVAGAFSLRAANAQVNDNAGIFSADAIDQANGSIGQLRDRHRHELLVETYKEIPADRQGDLKPEGDNGDFFEKWAASEGRSKHISGVVVLICLEPRHIQIVVGNETRKRLFTMADREELQKRLKDALHNKEYDRALTETAQFVLERFDAHDPRDTGATSSSNNSAGTTTPPYSGTSNYTHYSNNPGPECGAGGMGGFICLFIGVILIVVVLKAVFRSVGGQGGGWGGGQRYYPPNQAGYQGGYNPRYGYPPPQSGGGFGSGFLGGLLGGAVGGYAEDRLMHRDSGGGYVPPQTDSPPPQSDSGGGFTPDSSFSGGGTDFGSSDSGSSGGDSGGGGGGGDSGSSGSDF